MKSLIPPLSICYKKRVYSPNRILYPLKRVDFDHKGERNTEITVAMLVAGKIKGSGANVHKCGKKNYAR